MKTITFGALRAFLLLAVIVGLAACSTAPTYTAMATHTQQQVDSPMPTGSITVPDENLIVTVRVMGPDEPNYLAKTGACYQLDVTVQSKSTEPIELVGNDASVNGKRVVAGCNLEALFDLPTGTWNSMVAVATGALTQEENRANLMVGTLLYKRVLQGSAKTQGFDYVPKDRTYEGFYFTYKMGGVEHGFPIPFTSNISVATTTSPPQ
jgi:hypothetical protein